MKLTDYITFAIGSLAVAAGLLAAWVATVPPSDLPSWLKSTLLIFVALSVAMFFALMAYGLYRKSREPARIIFIEGSRVEIVGLWDAMDYFRRATRWGEHDETRNERHLRRMCIERFLDENGKGNLAFYGKLIRASSYRAITMLEMDQGYLNFQEAVLHEDKTNSSAILREDISVDYNDLVRLVRRYKNQ